MSATFQDLNRPFNQLSGDKRKSLEEDKQHMKLLLSQILNVMDWINIFLTIKFWLSIFPRKLYIPPICMTRILKYSSVCLNKKNKLLDFNLGVMYWNITQIFHVMQICHRGRGFWTLFVLFIEYSSY